MCNKGHNSALISERLNTLNTTTENIWNAIRQKLHLFQLDRYRDDFLRAVEERNMLKEGKNPYCVFRERELKIEAVKAERKRRKEIARRRKESLRSLKRYAEYVKRKDVEEEREKEMLKRYQKSLGRTEKEKKILQYMKRMTIGGKDIIDPSGDSFRIFPSEVSKIKTRRFGTGIDFPAKGLIMKDELHFEEPHISSDFSSPTSLN